MSPTPRSYRLTAIVFLLVALLVLAAVHGAVVPAHDLVPAGHPSGEPSISMTQAAAVRSGPGGDYLILAVAQPGEQFPLLGTSPDRSWWRIDLDGQPAWLPAAATHVRAETRIATVGVGGAN